MNNMNLSPMWLSFKTATIATIIVFITGVFLARLMARHSFRGKGIIEAIFMLPLVLPPTVVGFGLLYLFGKNGIIGGIFPTLFDFQFVLICFEVFLTATVFSFPLIITRSSAVFKQ